MFAFLVVGGLKSTFAQVDYSCLHSTSWKMNDKGDSSSHFGVETNVLSSELSNGQWEITSYGIPNYDRKFTTADITTLNSRPKAATDFENGQTTAVAGEEYSFGDDIGYSSQACTMGYWPPGIISDTYVRCLYAEMSRVQVQGVLLLVLVISCGI